MIEDQNLPKYFLFSHDEHNYVQKMQNEYKFMKAVDYGRDENIVADLKVKKKQVNDLDQVLM